MKKFLLFLMFALFCIPWAANAQSTLTVCNGTTTNGYVPIYGSYVDTEGQNSEFIIPADSLEELLGGTISKLTFYISGSPATWGNPTVQVYMGEVEGTTLSSLKGPASFTTVWTGVLSNQNATMEITLSMPYIYEGGNLLIGMYVQTASSTYNFTSFSGITTPSGSSMYFSGSSYGSPTSQSFLPKTTFTYTPGEDNCPKPTLSVSNVTTSSATLSWVCDTDYPFDLEYGTDNTFTTTTGVDNLEGTSYVLTDLSPNTTYYVRVQTDCDMDLSYWSTKSFTTANPCAAPTGFTPSNITGSSATISWTAGYQETAWTVKYKKSSESSWDNATSVSVNGTPTTSLTGLDGLTVYNVRVYNCTGESDPYLSGNFTTAASFPYSQDFSSSTSIPTGWSQYSGLLANVMAGTALTSTSYGWSNGTSNSVLDGNHLYSNIYGTSCMKWIVTPAIPVESGARLTFDVAYTAYSGTAVNPATTGTDDKFVVLASTDNMATWTILRQWDNAGSEYVLNELTPATLHQIFDLAGYAGQNVIVAFYGESTVSNADNNIHVDNVVFELTPSCEKPTGLAVTANSVTAHGATITWTSDASAWQIQLGDADPIDVTAATYTFTDLAPETAYSVKVRANCDGTFSEWTTPVSFTTAIACPAPTGLAASNITAHGVTISWTAEEGAVYQYVLPKTSEYEEGGNIIYTEYGTENTKDFINLDPETSYTFVLRKDCNEEGYSQVVTKTFTTGEACPAPTGLAASDITGHTATLNWNGTSNSYIVSYRTAATEVVPFGQNFENGLGGWTFTSGNATNGIGGGGSNPAGIISTTTAAHNGTSGFRFSSYSQKTDDETYDQYLVSPELTVTGELKFWYKMYGTNDHLYVGFSTTNDLESFDWTEISNSSSWQAYTNELSGDVKYIAIHYFGDYAFYAYVDDITVGASEVPASEWQTVTANASPATITGLAPETVYEAKVQGDCGDDGMSLESSIVTFTTDVACPAPTNVVMSEITTTTAVIDWVDHAGASAWYITYDPSNPDLHQTFATTHPYTLTGLTPDSTYNLQVAAVCGGSDGASEWSPVVTFTTLPLCQVPTNLVASDVTGHTANLSWSGNGDSYKVYLATNPNFFSADFAGEIPAEMTNNSAYPWTIVDGHIQSGNAGISSSTSEISVTVTYPEDGVIEFDAECKGEGSSTAWDKCIFSIDGTAQFTHGADVSGWNHYSYNVTAGEHTFVWSYTKDGSVNPTGDYFAVDNIVAKNPDANLEWSEPIIVENAQYAFTGLVGGTTYLVQVQSVCGEDESGLSETCSFSTPITCPAPTEATVTYTEGLTAEVSWTSDAESFNIDLNGTIIENVTNPYTLENLAYSTEYTVKVQAVCGTEDMSTWTVAGSFTTGEFCPAPTDFTYTIHTDGITVSWDGSADGYEMEYAIDNKKYFDFEDGTLQGWTNLIVNEDGGQWLHSNENLGAYDYTGYAHGGTGFAMCYSYVDYDGAYNTDAYLVSPRMYQINEGDSLNFWYDMANDTYPEDFAVCVATAANPTASDFTSIWSLNADKGNSPKSDARRRNIRSDNWREVTIDLSSYAGQSIRIAFRDVNEDMYEVWIDDVTIGDGNSNITWIPVGTVTNPYTLNSLDASTSYMLRVRSVCDGEAGAWSNPLPFTTLTSCDAGIVLNEANPTWTANFDNMTNVTEPYTGVQPSCWTWTRTTEIGDLPDTLPHLYNNSEFAHSGDYSLRLWFRGVYAMPELAEGVNINRVKMSFWSRHSYPFYTMMVGVMDNPTDPTTFVPVAYVDNGNSTGVKYFEFDFSKYEGEGRYIAFKNVRRTNNELDGHFTDLHSVNYIDDITLTLMPETDCTIELADLPYTENFDAITSSTNTETGATPVCWEVVKEDAAMSLVTAPQVYYNSSYAYNGYYSLRMVNRGVYAMPTLAEDIDINKVRLSMHVRQPNALYQLQVGVWDEVNETFTPVALVNNSSTGVEKYICDFSNYDGTGRRIAFRNVLGGGKTWSYSYNYIDNVVLSLAECAAITETYTESFETVTTNTSTAATGAAPACWEVVEGSETLSYDGYPQVYYNGAFAHDGSYSLRMLDRCVYAMPEFADGVNIGDLSMTMYVRQPYSFYQLEVGVWNGTEFTVVETVNNSDDAVTEVTVDFGGYEGTGRIAFRNSLNSGKTWSYSYNYIDEISFTVNASKMSADGGDNLDEADADRYLNNIAVYPNPTTGVLHIDAVDVEKVECYSQMGQLVGVYDNVNELNISELAEGVYMLRITVPQGVTMRKVVKR